MRTFSLSNTECLLKWTHFLLVARLTHRRDKQWDRLPLYFRGGIGFGIRASRVYLHRRTVGFCPWLYPQNAAYQKRKFLFGDF